jgi:hypothetical protein
MKLEPAPKVEERGISSVSVLLGRLMWFIIGPFVLMGITYGIVTRGSEWLSGPKVAYVVFVVLMVWGRWYEQRSGVATTAQGKPATWEHHRRYVRVLSPVATVTFVLANILGNHILSGAD